MTGRQHGTRAKYVSDKCRCDACREANRLYHHVAKVRRAPTTVDAAAARKHIKELRLAGIGRRRIAEVSGLSLSAVCKIISGETERIRVSTESALLSVHGRSQADHGYVDAGPTWDIIAKLLEAGWTKGGIDAALGGRGRALQLKKDRITAVKAKAIAELWERQQQGQASPPDESLAMRTGQLYRSLEDRPWEGTVTWMRRAACKSPHVPNHMFFPHQSDERTLAAAVEVCAICNVSAECLAYALRNRCVGVWGGTTDEQRKGMAKPCVDCGTDVGVRPAHSQRCAPCQEVERRRQKYAYAREVARYREVAS